MIKIDDIATTKLWELFNDLRLSHEYSGEASCYSRIVREKFETIMEDLYVRGTKQELKNAKLIKKKN